MGKKNKLKRKKQQQSTPPSTSITAIGIKTPVIPFNICLGIIVVFCFVLYGNTIGHGYALDDLFVTAQNSMVAKGISGIPDIFSSSYIDSEFFERKGGYRPITMTTFAVEYTFFEENTSVSHFINIIFYALSCVILFCLLCYLLPHYPILFPLLVTLFFIAYPRHTEVVASLKSRDELLSFLFGISATFMLLKYYDKRKIYYALIGLLLLALGQLSKESTVAFSLSIPLVFYFFRDISLKKSALSFVFLLVFTLFITPIIVLFTVLIPFEALDSPRPVHTILSYPEHPLVREDNWINRIATHIYIMGYYLKMVVFPTPMVYYYGSGLINAVSWLNPWVWLSTITYIVLGSFTILQLVHKKRHLLIFSFLYFLCALSVYSNIAGLVPGVVGDRFLFHPSVGFCIALAWLSFKFAEIKQIESKASAMFFSNINKNILILFSLFILLPYSYLTIDRNQDWKNILTLMDADLHKIQSSITGLTIYGGNFAQAAEQETQNQHLREQYARKAAKQFERALSLHPTNTKAIRELGTLYCEILNQPQKGLDYLKAAIQSNPDKAHVYYQTGHCFQQAFNQMDSAIYYYNTYLAKKETDITLRSQLVQYYTTTGDLKKAKALTDEIIAIDANSSHAYISQGMIKLAEQNTLGAVQDFEQAVAIDKNASNLLDIIIEYYHKTGHTKKHQYYLNLKKIAK